MPIITGEQLTKKFFCSLEPGVYLRSCVGWSPMEPDFAEYVAEPTERNEQWQRIRSARVDQRQCDVFESKQAFDDWCKGWKQRTDRPGWYRDEV